MPRAQLRGEFPSIVLKFVQELTVITSFSYQIVLLNISIKFPLSLTSSVEAEDCVL